MILLCPDECLHVFQNYFNLSLIMVIINFIIIVIIKSAIHYYDLITKLFLAKSFDFINSDFIVVVTVSI